MNQLDPRRYPAPVAVAGKTRDQVRAETREAISSGDILATGESGLRLNELYPRRYERVRAGDPPDHRALATTTPSVKSVE